MRVTISSVHGREILDSRGRPTVEVEVELSDGTCSRASVPSGESKGRHEAVELRDGDRERYRGLGVLGAVSNVKRVIAPALCGCEALDQATVDSILVGLDSTPTKATLGSNAVLGVSLAVARAAAKSSGVPLWRYLGGQSARTLPLPMVNMISGGLHARQRLDIQDFLIVPVGAPGYSRALEMCVAIYAALGDELTARGLSTLRADEGGYGPLLPSNVIALELLECAVVRAGYVPDEDVAFALDVAASHFYDTSEGLYWLSAERTKLDAAGLIAMLTGWTDRYAICSIEDPLAEDDWEGWQLLTAQLGERLQLIGDDLFTTNMERLERGIELGAANAVLVKMNQIGTLSETLAVIDRAQQVGFRTVVSARSGETEDVALADLAVATNAGQIKVGSVTQSDRLAKYNQLLRIEQQLGDDGTFAGRGALRSTRK